MTSSEEYKKTIFIYECVHWNSKQVIYPAIISRDFDVILTKKKIKNLNGKYVMGGQKNTGW